MGHLQAYRVAVIGKHRANRSYRTADTLVVIRRLIFAALTLLVASVSGSPSYAQSGPFTGLAGSWSGGGNVSLDDGSSERIRCRATYAVGAGGNGLNQTLTCASDSYKFNLASNVMAQGGAISGTWSEATRNLSGSVSGNATTGKIQAKVSGGAFSAGLNVYTNGDKQGVTIVPQGTDVKGVTVTMVKAKS